MQIIDSYAFAFWVELVFVISLAVVIQRSRRGMKIPELYKVAGLEAVDEAIGRCTEMGRPAHYSAGIGGLSDVGTLASLSVLSYVAKQCAQYDTEVIQTNRNVLVYSVAEEVIRQAFTEVNKPDAFKPENVRWISDDQFAYASGVTGIMHRERPAANFLLGVFFAESMIFAEVGATVGAIQIAATSNVTQTPFFVAACDYVLLGEELYAAGAYLSREPVMVGTLVAQDWGKMTAIILIVIGTLITSSGSNAMVELLSK